MTRSSSSRKQKPGKKHSKFSLMRKKLTLPETSQMHNETQYKEQEVADAENMQEKEFAEQGAGVRDEGNTNQDSANVFTQAKTKKLFQQASPMKLVRLSKKLKVDQKTLIRDSDYGGLVDILCSKLHPELCQFLMDRFEPNSCMLVFPGRGAIPVNEESVQKVLGVAWGELEVLYGQHSGATEFMTKQLGNSGKKQPTIASLEKKLVGMKKADRNFMRLFITYAMTSVLAPTTGVRISPRVYPSLVNIKQAKQLNMCKFVIMIICKALKPGGKGNVAPCMLYLMIKYLDSLELEGMNISDEGTRVSVWTNAMVTKAIKQDIGKDGCFGAAPLKTDFASSHSESAAASSHSESAPASFRATPFKPEFASSQSESEAHEGLHSEASINEDEEGNTSTHSEVKNEAADDVLSESEQEEGETILFSDPEIIAKFIRKNTPRDSTIEDIAIYRESIEYACHGFEATLQKLVRNLSARTVRQPNPPSPQGIKAPATKKCKSNPNGGPTGDVSKCDNVEEEDVNPAVPVSEQEKANSEEEMLVRRNKRAKTSEGDSSKNVDAMPPDAATTMNVDKVLNKQQEHDMPAVLASPTQGEDVNAAKEAGNGSVTSDGRPSENVVPRVHCSSAGITVETRDAFFEKSPCLASEATKTDSEAQVPSKEGAKPDTIASLVHHMRSINAATLPGNKENLPPDPSIL